MAELSPQAQAVLDACDQAFDQCGTTAQGLAAALRAAADYDPDGSTTDDYDEGWRAAMAFVEAIAAELEACCEWLRAAAPAWERQLRTARRPKPPSPKEEALRVLEKLIETRRIVDPEYPVLRYALDALYD